MSLYKLEQEGEENGGRAIDVKRNGKCLHPDHLVAED